MYLYILVTWRNKDFYRTASNHFATSEDPYKLSKYYHVQSGLLSYSDISQKIQKK